MADTNGAGASSVEGDLDVKPPADVIIPPSAVREAIHKSADFIHRRGGQTEEQLRARARENAKFSFLNQDDSYYAYYRWYFQMLEEGKGAAAGRSRPAAHDTKPKGPEKPADFRFSAKMPAISAKDLEILRLTALYAAKNGENWLKELRNRESANYQFDFLRPTHSLFRFFRSIVDQYKILLEEESTVEARIEELQHNIKDRFHILKRARERADYIKYQASQKEEQKKAEEDEKREIAAIDWNDAAIIGTITWDEADETADMDMPTTLNDLQSASFETKAKISIAKRLEEAAPDEETYYNVSSYTPAPSGYPSGYPGYPPPAAAPAAPPVQPVFQPPPPVPQEYRTPTPQRGPQEDAAERAAQLQAAAKAPGTMRIRNDYVPRAAAKKGGIQTQQCPNCKQQIPVNEIDEHIRIELLDPRWKEQRDKAEARYSTIINTADVANNLKRFASQRDDIYDGASGLPISEEEAARRKKAATSYDGQPDPTKDAVRIQEMQTMNVQEQLRRIQERHGGK